MRTVLIEFGWALAFVVFLFITTFVPVVGHLGELMLGPGYVLPEYYWGAVHDPLQLLLALMLNIGFYTCLFLLGLWGWQRVRRHASTR